MKITHRHLIRLAQYVTSRGTRILLLLPLTCLWGAPTSEAAPTASAALRLKPTQQGIRYDVPSKKEVASCTVAPLKQKGVKGWLVLDSVGRRLRCFIDSNKDNIVDQWCYYSGGIEVYRDIDSNFNRKVDQHRCLNTAGMRWGIDKNEDGTVERWKIISAQEVTAELVRAMTNRDVSAFERLLISRGELKQLGLGSDAAKKIAASTIAAKEKFIALGKSKRALTAETLWLHFSATQPGIVPAGTNGSTKDLNVYENVVAMIETDGEPGFVQVGTLVKVGDAWRLIDAPSLAEQTGATSAAAGLFFNVSQGQTPQLPTNLQAGGISKKIQALLSKLEKTEAKIATAGPAERGRLYEQQASVLEELAEASSAGEQKDAWLKQLADNLSAAVQSGSFPKGTARLDALHSKLKSEKATPAAIAYVRYRGLLAGYSASMQEPKADYAKIQTQWLANLATFVNEHPEAEDAAEAMLQIAIAEEFAGEEEKAKTWYRKIGETMPTSGQAKKATGAIRRIDSPGKPLSLKGASTGGKVVDLKEFSGRVVLLHYWATWCEPCKADMAILRDLAAKYGAKGFSIVGVNVDNDRALAVDYLKKERILWPNIHEPGGLESRPANELGILTLPTMLLIDKKGNVVNRNIHTSEVEMELKKRIP